jgi:hypothetical protein
LVAAHPHKATIRHPNGFRTFKELRVGEKLNLPEKWFNGELDKLPPAYFAALPHHDGVTRSTHGVSGTLGDLAQYDVAAAAVATLAALGDQPFSNTVNGVAAAIDAAVGEIHGTGAPAVYAMPYAQEVLKATATARQRATALATAITAGDQTAGAQARNDILHDLSGALTSAQLALQAFYGDPAQVRVDIGPAKIDPAQVLVDVGQAKIDPVTLVAAAKAAAAAIGADPNFCAAVAQPGSSVNAAVHAFKTAWNAANPKNPVPVNTGKYEQATADVLRQLLGTAPAACGGGAQVPPPPPIPLVVPVVPPQPRSGLGVGGVLGLTALGAGAVGGAIYLATRAPSKGRRRRVRRVPSEEEADL